MVIVRLGFAAKGGNRNHDYQATNYDNRHPSLFIVQCGLKGGCPTGFAFLFVFSIRKG